ncbi:MULTISPECIES: DUF998 domain-containing protein [unclassified Microbacterium]|uniref:DUF998 domain-containing protein n=1 Tax=unclassified Microbacterium TaxID=2609290 RepID=UPI00214C594B|nr:MULTISPECIES: DUF998 domain-containing protein [unclassified Microbacterium]MCR2810937.1 DUF998 domain-containing protein [Microbacterium sp. zg.B185]WIM19664.1 DUF998 domain-containing protein [Microbacterium sp. zg-B185]
MTSAATRPPADESAAEPAAVTRSQATSLAYASGVLGAVYGLILALAAPDELFADGPTSFALWAAAGSGISAAAASGIGYWRSRSLPGQEWRQSLSTWKFLINTLSVVIVHTVLAFIETYVIYRLVGLGFVGLPVHTLWSVVLMAVTVGLTAQLVYASVSEMTTQRMSSLLRTFIAFGIITAMVIAPEPDWWKVHFSHLGTFDDLSSLLFNGTLVAAGLLVTTFAVYIAHDMQTLVDAGVLSSRRSPRVVSALFVGMGAAFAGVGIFSVDVNRLVHDIAALGLASMFLALLGGGAKLLRGMPRHYFIWSWAILATTLLSAVMFALGLFSLTAIEIIVFTLIFGWISLFIRYLGQAGAAAELSPAGPVRR